MITIFKYTLSKFATFTKVKIPVNAEILSAAAQGTNLCVWAKVDTEAETEERIFEAFGTGHEIPFDMGIDYTFIDTAYMSDGLVFHVFERQVRSDH